MRGFKLVIINVVALRWTSFREFSRLKSVLVQQNSA